jgi:fatty-acyl-CoA synthase
MTVDQMPLALSYTRGPARTLLDLTIGDLLHRTADRCGDRLAVASCHQERRFTWAELSEQADRVGLWSTNCIEWLMMHMGCARAPTPTVRTSWRRPLPL